MCSRKPCISDHDVLSHINEDINSNSSNTFGEHNIINIKLKLFLL